MDSKIKNWLVGGIIVVIILGGIGLFLYQQNKPGQLDDFAKCLKDKGTVFYGTFWCSHCQSQKKLFGNSAKHLPYVECSTSNSNGQLKVCKDANITSYPTWQFSDGSRQEGEIALSVLAEKSSCKLLE